ncbi:MAG: magnesium-translocating P-type ATPase [Chlorobiaceae bacterium]|nr:magnesium-translocating P-type ATPase [Chlorobiaceae bacterium]NTV15965.1 magnesium-translocating P-type ATPase [Chlorobiaceae bacterium]
MNTASGYPQQEEERFWTLSSEDALLGLESNRNGLSEKAAQERLKQYGPNSLKGSSKTSGFLLFLMQFKSPVTLLLIFAALLSFALHDRTDAAIILLIVLVSGLLGWWQEKGAARAVDQLMKMVQIKCRVMRNGQDKEIHIEEVVPGDVVLLSAGDMIPGDCLLLESKELFVDEAAFTGETYPVEKNRGIVAPDTPLAKRSNILLMGAHVISGKAEALVMKTAMQTEFGKISDTLRLKAPETDFERGVRRFGYMLMEITMVLVVIIFAVNVLLHKPILDSFLFSMALAVGLTPQLLPAIISVNLASGARNMAKQQVIVKRLSSIENFGSMNILCSDKTGTITEGTVKLHKALSVSGEPSDKVLEYAWLNASLQQGFHNPIDEAVINSRSGSEHLFEVQSEVPYDFIRKRLSVQIRNASENIVITKGALKQVLAVCSRVETENGIFLALDEKRSQIMECYEQLSSKGYRTLGVAWKTGESQQNFTRKDETEMIFLGFITFFDPPKANIQETIRNLEKIGVNLKIITGDNTLVAESLGRQIGLVNPRLLSGMEIRKMSDLALMQQSVRTDIFAEVEPDQKERIIHSLKKAGNVVGFMGDGINDASALHAADVGISVDSAVDVAKEAAEIVLLNHDLRVLEQGIREGRKTFTNTMKYVFMATSANFGNMFSMAGASLFLPFLPLLPKQILLTNLLTDFPEITISGDRVDAINIARPHRWDIRFIQRFMITFGMLSSLFDFFTFGVLHYVLHAGESQFQTGWFVESVISASLIVLVIRTRLPFFKSLPGRYLLTATLLVVLGVLALPFTPLAMTFGFARLPLLFYGWMLLIVVMYILSAEVTKHFFYKRLIND